MTQNYSCSQCLRIKHHFAELHLDVCIFVPQHPNVVSSQKMKPCRPKSSQLRKLGQISKLMKYPDKEQVMIHDKHHLVRKVLLGYENANYGYA